MTKEEFEDIDSDLAHYEKETELLKNENSTLKKANDESSNNQSKNVKILEMEKEGLVEKIRILQNTLDESAKSSNSRDFLIEKMDQSISNLRNDHSGLLTKYNQMCDEMEIYKKNAIKIFLLEKTVQELTKENEKLSEQIKNLSNCEDYKIKYMHVVREIKELTERNNILNGSNHEMKTENEKLSNENFEKFESINILQGELKVKSHKIEELENENKIHKKQLDDLTHRLKEAEYNVKNGKVLYESQLKELKKDIDKLVKVNETVKTENVKLNEQLGNIQHYTSLAKASKESLTKKDFSILETMSRRVEELEVKRILLIESI
jgi:hypothetical protein